MPSLKLEGEYQIYYNCFKEFDLFEIVDGTDSIVNFIYLLTIDENKLSSIGFHSIQI